MHLWSVRDTIAFKQITEIMTQLFEELTAPILKKELMDRTKHTHTDMYNWGGEKIVSIP